MKALDLYVMESIVAGKKVSCISRGIVTPFMVVFSGFISSSYLDSWWVETVDNCYN